MENKVHMTLNELCWKKLFGVIESKLNVIYGEAASGKTSFVLSLAKNNKEKKIGYINTEGEINSVRVLQILGNEDNYIYVEVKELLEELVAIMELYELGIDFLVIDSVNALYRLELTYDQERTTSMFTFILAMLKGLSQEKKTVVSTSQVSFDENTPTGLIYISHYADNLLKIVKSEKDNSRLIYLNENYYGKGTIDSTGFRWISCQI